MLRARVLGLALLAVNVAAGPLRAEDAPQGCDVPSSLLEDP